MKPVFAWIVMLLMCSCSPISGQAPVAAPAPAPGAPAAPGTPGTPGDRPAAAGASAPDRQEQELKEQIANELAGLAAWCSERNLNEQARRLVDEVSFVDPRNRQALALQVPLADDTSPPAVEDRQALRELQASTGRAVAPLYLELFAQRHRPAQNALYDVYLIRALEHDPGLAAPVFDRTWKTALRKKDWSRARMLLSQGHEYVPVSGYESRLRDIDASEMAEIRRQLVPGGTFLLKFPELGPTIKKDYRLMQMRVVLPDNYSPNRQWPLYISFGGGTGSDRPNRLTDGLGFVATALPFPRNPRNLAQGSFDPVTLWSSYKPMLEKLERVLPNLDPARRVVFGFSNGANALTALVAFSDGQFTQQFRYLIIHEGGMYQRNWSDEVWRELGSCSLLYSGGDRGSGVLIKKMYREALDRNVDAELLIFKGGHEMNPQIGAEMRQWIQQKALD